MMHPRRQCLHLEMEAGESPRLIVDVRNAAALDEIMCSAFPAPRFFRIGGGLLVLRNKRLYPSGFELALDIRVLL